jgi:MOSC domain-containing protein YiiM
MTGRVEHLCIAARHGGPIVSVEEVRAVADKGLEGDRNFGRVRQVTVVCAGELAAAAAELGIPAIPPGATRRNITVDLPSLPRTAGSVIRIGEVTLEVLRDCPPCEVMEVAVAVGAREALRGRAGISARVAVGGVIRVGDPVEVTA